CHREHNWLQCIEAARNSGLQRGNDLSQTRHRVYGIVRARSMSALAIDRNRQNRERGHSWAINIMKSAAILQADVQTIVSKRATPGDNKYALINHKVSADRTF